MKTCTKCGATKDDDLFLRAQNLCMACKAEYGKVRYQKNRDKILEKNKVRYQRNRDVLMERQRTWNRKNKKKIAERDRAYYLENKENIAEKDREYRQNNKEKITERRKAWAKRIKQEYLDYYGAECKQCGLSIPSMLNLDHVNNDGHADRKKHDGGLSSCGGGIGAYLRAKKAGRLDTLQLLCANHNQIKQKNNIRSLNPNKSYHRTRLEIIDYYGGECACCGQSNPEVLELDHIANNGYIDRRKGLHMGADAVFSRAKKENRLNSLQVLCRNCNHSKRVNGGKCAHPILRKTI